MGKIENSENKNQKIITIESYESIKKTAGNYAYQLDLTSKLDEVKEQFNQEIINEIVLWKVNRYSEISFETLSLLNQISKDDTVIDTELTKQILRNLLNTNGIRLAMASTILS